MKVAIIEDEPLSQNLLLKLLINNYPEIEITKVLDSVEDSVEYFSKETVDLIFMDIHLKDGSCFDIFEKINIKTPIILTTAFDEYAIKAFDINSLSYILKPLSENKVKKAMEKFNQINTRNNIENVTHFLSEYNSEHKYKKRITIKLGDRIVVVDEKDIAYFIAKGRTCYLYTKDNNKYIVDFSLDSLSIQLNSKIFFRISRDCITSFDSIKNISRHYKGRLSILLTPDYENPIIISQERVSDFMKWINGE